MNRARISSFLLTIVVLAAGAALVIYPQEVSAAVRANLTLCADTLLPNLFPFFVLSALIIRGELFRPFERMLEPLMRYAFHLPGSCASALVLGLVGGYPTGAKTAAELYRSSRCSRDEAQRLLSFCNNCGPAFLFGVVGGGMFGHPRYGLLLAGVHYAAALLTGVIMNRCAPIPAGRQQSHSAPQTPLAAAFVESVTGALRAMLDLCSFVLCFGAITKLFSLSGFPAIVAGLLFPFLTLQAGENFLMGLLEMTHGVTAITDETLSMRLILTAGLLGWGGVSVHCQVLALLRDTDLSATSYLKGKLIHAVFSMFLMRGLLYGMEMVCLAAGCSLLFLPCRGAKKSSGKSAKGIV